MITEDHVLRACREYERIEGHKPKYACVTLQDFSAVQHLLRNVMDKHGHVHIGPYRLMIQVSGTTLPGQLLVTHRAIPSTARIKDIKSLSRLPFSARLRPGGVTVQH